MLVLNLMKSVYFVQKLSNNLFFENIFLYSKIATAE